MSDINETVAPLATEAGQDAIVLAINNISSFSYAVRAENAATTATQKASEASNSAADALAYKNAARNWATKMDTYVDTETITIPSEQEGEEDTTETVYLFSARYYAALAQDFYNNMTFDNVPTQNSTNLLTSGTIYTALADKADKSTTYTKTETDNLINTRLAELVASAPAALDTLQELATALGNDPNFATTIATQLGNKADKSDTYTKTEVDTALSNVQSTLTFDNVPTANSDNPVKSSGIKTVLDGKQDTLTFDSTPTANSTNPVTSGGVYTALQNVNIDIDDEITEDSENPVTSAAIYEALLNLPSGSEISGDVVYDVLSLPDYVNSLDLLSGYTPTTTIREVMVSKDGVARIYGECSTTGYSIIIYVNGIMIGSCSSYTRITMDRHIVVKSGDIIGIKVDGGSNWRNVSITLYPFVPKILSEQMYSNVLYENSSGFTTGNITLKDDWNNYDIIVFNAGDSDGYRKDHVFLKLYFQECYDSYLNSGNKTIILDRYSSGWLVFNVTGNNTLSCTNQSSNMTTYKITGIKFAKGGYSGIVSDARMTVKSGTGELASDINSDSWGYIPVTFDSPMPDTNYVVSVSISNHNSINGADKVRIGIANDSKTVNGFRISIVARDGYKCYSGLKIDWIAIRPNSYTREGMVEDVLFSNASGVNSGTINLSGNISDYDLILFTTDRHGDSNDKTTNIHTITSSQLLELTGTQLGQNMFLLHGFNEDYIKVGYVNDNTLLCGTVVLRLFILKITGIKFGRYVSGVAVDTTVTQNSDAVVTSGAVYDALLNIPTGSGDVTTNTDQNITGTKTFVGSKKVAFKQSTTNDKLGFTLFGNTGTERGYLEFNPTNTVDGVTGLMTLGNYATSAAGLTQVGFRRYSNISGASGAYNLLMPMIADAKSPFSLTTTYTNFYLPLGFTDGTTTVRTAKSGVVDLSPLLQAAINSIPNANGVSY